MPVTRGRPSHTAQLRWPRSCFPGRHVVQRLPCAGGGPQGCVRGPQSPGLHAWTSGCMHPMPNAVGSLCARPATSVVARGLLPPSKVHLRGIKVREDSLSLSTWAAGSRLGHDVARAQTGSPHLQDSKRGPPLQQSWPTTLGFLSPSSHPRSSLSPVKLYQESGHISPFPVQTPVFSGYCSSPKIGPPSLPPPFPSPRLPAQQHREHVPPPEDPSVGSISLLRTSPRTRGTWLLPHSPPAGPSAAPSPPGPGPGPVPALPDPTRASELTLSLPRGFSPDASGPWAFQTGPLPQLSPTQPWPAPALTPVAPQGQAPILPPALSPDTWSARPSRREGEPRGAVPSPMRGPSPLPESWGLPPAWSTGRGAAGGGPLARERTAAPTRPARRPAGLCCVGRPPAPGPPLSSPVSTEARAQRAFADMASFYIWGPVILPRAPHWGKRNHRPEGTKVWPPEATCWKIDFLLFIRRQDGKEPLTLPSLSESPPPPPFLPEGFS